MNEGYVYILTNTSLKGLLKIGSTTYGAEKRAKQLSRTTSLPTPFDVAYEVYVSNYEDFEDIVHSELNDYRINPKREFFNVTLDKAIEVIEALKENPNFNPKDNYSSIEILPELKTKYKECIKPDIVSVKIYQEIDRVYFEYTQYTYMADYLKDQTIHRIDLGFIVGDIDDNSIFNTSFSVKTNAELFLELSYMDMINCVGEIFK